MPKKSSQDSFKTLSSEIAQGFLQTVMVVDDQAYYVEELEVSQEVSTLRTAEIKKPGGIRIGKQAERKSTPELSPSISNAQDIFIHRLNAKTLTDAFADMGIACTVIRPKDNKEPDLKNRILKLAQKSDIIVFDWVLLGEDAEGKKISELISEITKNSVNENKKLRLIAVYTGNSNLDIVLNTVSDKLTDDGFSPEKDDENFMITVDAVRISVFAKKYAEIPEGSHFYKRKIGEETIPARLVDDFTEMTSGLVSNVALQSFATIRNNTHHILAKFHPSLDAPFLAHRLMLPHPSDANEHLANLIGAEITALLEGKKVGDFADVCLLDGKQRHSLNEWLKHFVGKKKDWHKDWNLMVLKGGTTSKTIVDAIYKILSEDGDAEEKLRKNLLKPSISEKIKKKVIESTSAIHTLEVTKRFIEDEDKAEALDREFAYLTTVSSFYKEKPLLRFGTILKEITNPDKTVYWLCVQPLCDCIRISKKRKFPLLKLKIFDEEKHNKFDFVLFDEEYICASVVYKPFDTEFVEFKSNRTKVISSEKVNEEFIFKSVTEKKLINGAERETVRTFRWLGELKFAQAQRISNQYASNISRVGLDESEWLRRWATFGKMVKDSSLTCAA